MLARLSILQRVTAGFLGAMLLLLGLAGAGVFTAAELGGTFARIRASIDRSVEVDGAMRAALDARQRFYRYSIDGDPADRDAALALAQEAESMALRDAELYVDRPATRRALTEAAASIDGFRTAFAEAAQLEEARKRMEAEALEATQAARDAFDDLRDTAADMERHFAMAQAGRVIEEIWLSARRLIAYSASGREADKAAWDDNLADMAGDAQAAIEAAAAVGGPLPALAATASEKLSVLRGFVEPLAALIERRDAVAEGRLRPAERAMIDRLAEVQATTVAGRVAQMEAGAETARLGLNMAIGAAVLGAVALVAIAMVIGRSISGAVARMATDMGRLAAQEKIEVTGADLQHELGDMARALKVFQGQQEDLARAEAQRIEAEKAAEAARRDMLHRLRDSVGAVVDSGVEGDFNRRVEAKFDDPELSELAASLNRLMDSVGAGLGAAQSAIAQLADGDLDAEMKGDFRGAFAELKTNVRACVSRLQGLIAGIRAGADVMRAAAKEMARDAETLSGRAEAQAASLEETAATMEQMSATVKGNADNSRAAADLSSGASRDAIAGAEVVAATSDLIGRIEEGSARIGEITGVIDSIAFQTNLLALNAAVEAARAGEAGKGFAVVAAEVRTLAQRSAEAARDIKRLIEESNAQVRSGAASARQAGDAIGAIVSGVQRLEATIGEISAASVEQSSGVQEIASAVASLDETTQQSANLAQKSASRSKEMLETVDDLIGRVAEFRGGEKSAGRAAA